MNGNSVISSRNGRPGQITVCATSQEYEFIVFLTELYMPL